MDTTTRMPVITPDENGKIDVSALYDYYDYIDSVIAEKVKETLAEMRAELSRDTAPQPFTPQPFRPQSPELKSVAPLLSTPELDGLWISEYAPPELSSPNNNVHAPDIGLAESVLPAADTQENTDREKKASRSGFRKKISFFVIGVIVLAVSVQLLGSNGIIDFHSYADLTSKLFGTVFAG
ncbi:MAG: hypothetical protein LBL36_01015 [Clostridiales Family XIII bacterium]|jgi:hypothetical protein|nr:hypothetical protein [Clostridiales Family XIII bacterium]